MCLLTGNAFLVVELLVDCIVQRARQRVSISPGDLLAFCSMGKCHHERRRRRRCGKKRVPAFSLW